MNESHPSPDQLLSCPFCNGEPEIINRSVHCNSPVCEAQPYTAGQSVAEAIAAWNRRPVIVPKEPPPADVLRRFAWEVWQQSHNPNDLPEVAVKALQAAGGAGEAAPTPALTDETIRTMVMVAMGAASMCWENPAGAGVFDSNRALAVGDELIRNILAASPPTGQAIPAPSVDALSVPPEQQESSRQAVDRAHPDTADARRFRVLQTMYHAAHFYPQELDFPDGVALIFIAPKGTRVSADLGQTVDAAFSAQQKGTT